MNTHYSLIAIEIPSWIYSPLWYVFLILFACEIALPRIWLAIESLWWRAKLGNSLLAVELRRSALKQFQLLIDELVNDHGLPRPLAMPWAIVLRAKRLKRATVIYRRRKTEKSPEHFESMIDLLNRLWRQGSSPALLMAYVRAIEKMADEPPIDRELRLQGKSAVAIVKYALGKLIEGNRMGKENWKLAKKLESDFDSQLKWIASYSFFYSTLFLGRRKRAIDLMSQHWGRYYSALPDEEAGQLRALLSGKLILNPILALPRHFILAFALYSELEFLKEYWPSEAVFNNLSPEDQKSPVKWLESWYAVARSICEVEPISLNFSAAYSGFYLTLLLLDKNMPVAYLHQKINEAFDSIDDSSAIVSRYVKYGFSGLYHLVCGENEKAFDNLSGAASFSDISGNRFADVLFRCAHAVAAVRLNRSNRVLDPQVDFHMKHARKMADDIQSDFYTVLCDAAESAICLQRGQKARAQRYAESSWQGRTNTRILRIFDNDALETRSREADPNRLLLTT
jgi:hypothetical protein